VNFQSRGPFRAGSNQEVPGQRAFRPGTFPVLVIEVGSGPADLGEDGSFNAIFLGFREMISDTGMNMEPMAGKTGNRPGFFAVPQMIAHGKMRLRPFHDLIKSVPLSIDHCLSTSSCSGNYIRNDPAIF
jgi:hypothetical protein